MPVRSWGCARVWSKAKAMNGPLGRLVMSERWVALAARNVELGFRRHPFVPFLWPQGWGSRADGVSQLYRVSRGSNQTLLINNRALLSMHNSLLCLQATEILRLMSRHSVTQSQGVEGKAM